MPDKDDDEKMWKSLYVYIIDSYRIHFSDSDLAYEVHEPLCLVGESGPLGLHLLSVLFDHFFNHFRKSPVLPNQVTLFQRLQNFKI